MTEPADSDTTEKVRDIFDVRFDGDTDEQEGDLLRPGDESGSRGTPKIEFRRSALQRRTPDAATAMPPPPRPLSAVPSAQPPTSVQRPQGDAVPTTHAPTAQRTTTVSVYLLAEQADKIDQRSQEANRSGYDWMEQFASSVLDEVAKNPSVVPTEMFASNTRSSEALPARKSYKFTDDTRRRLEEVAAQHGTSMARFLRWGVHRFADEIIVERYDRAF